MKCIISPIGDFGGFGSGAWDVSQEATVVGKAYGQGYGHAMQFRNGALIDLTPDPSFKTSQANAINNLPTPMIVGEYRKSGNTKALLWSQGQFTDVNAILKSNWSIAQDINDDGLIVGTRGDSDVTQAFILNFDTNQIIIPFQDSLLHFGQAINKHGTIVGRASERPQGFLYHGGQVDFLETLGGNANGIHDIIAFGAFNSKPEPSTIQMSKWEK